MIDPRLIELIEEYATLPNGDIENICLYHDLKIYGDDADELLEVYAARFGVSVPPFCRTDYFPNEGDPVWDVARSLFRGRKEYKCLTIADLQKGIEDKKLEL
ncbi:MAG: DUF1493 family protein [Bacteroidales bacterium]|jgi:hypothetical protein|nr:DUF1493 family protein [Bacteroidales bacterium]